MHRPVSLLALLSACAPGATPADDVADTDTDAPGRAARWPACDPSATSQTISFVHVNDMHGGFNPDPAVPGESPLSRAVGYYRAVEAENPYTVWTDGGDDFEKGSVIEDLSLGEATVDLVEGMGFDARALGNHDYGYGEDIVLDHSTDPRAVVLASNVDYIGTRPSEWGAARSWIAQVGCVKVGFFSLNTRPYDGADRAFDGPYLEGVTTEDYDFLTQAQQWVDTLRDEVDVLVSLNHLGTGNESFVADNVTGIDLMLASHSHDVTYAPVEVNGARIVQAGSGSNFVLRMDVDVDLDSRALSGWRFEVRLNAPTSLPVDDAMEQVVMDVFTTWAPGLWEPVAETSSDLSVGQSARVIANAAIFVAEADGALFSTDYFKGSLPGGDVTLQDLFDLSNLEREPPGTTSWNSMQAVDVTGEDLQRAIDALRPTEFWVGPEVIDPSATYTIVVQKKNALYPELFLAGMPVFTNVTYVGEIWKVGHLWAEHRQGLCLHLDADTPIPGCTP